MGRQEVSGPGWWATLLYIVIRVQPQVISVSMWYPCTGEVWWRDEIENGEGQDIAEF